MGFFQTSGILNRRGFFGGASAPAYDSDAQAYITAVENADNQSLETDVKDAINTFVLGCKTDGIWTNLSNACILCGARTLDGILKPLVGATPTNNNFVSGDYDRKTGLIGNGTTKYLSTGIVANTLLQNDTHISGFVKEAPTSGTAVCVIASGNANTTLRIAQSSGSSVFNLHGPSVTKTLTGWDTNFLGASRAASSTFTIRRAGATSTETNTSQTPSGTATVLVFARRVSSGSGEPASYYNGRIAFYSLGKSLDLALLDSRVDTLISSIASAIP